MSPRGRLAAGIVGGLTMVAIGWTGLLIPSLIRSIEASFGQDDAGMGLVYLVYAVSYACGSFGGGPLTERLGRRRVLGGSVLVHGMGIAGLGIVPTWPLFAATAAVAGLGAGSLDGGANGLVLDAYRDGRGRAMNLLHASFSVGALSAPLVVGSLVELGTAWQAIMIVSGALVMPLAAGYVLVPMPSGRRARTPGGRPTEAAGPAGRTGGRRLLTGPLMLLGIAIAAYVASELGISSWLVRFLDPAPLATATLALSLYWAGIAVGRLVSSAVADRFDHLRYTIACSMALAVLVVAALLAPSLPLSIAAFALAGVASGPVFPMIVAIGGEHQPDRSAAVGGFLGGMAVVGSTVYPPAMGFLSVTVGLGVAMLGTAVLALGCMLALMAFGRLRRRRHRGRTAYLANLGKSATLTATADGLTIFEADGKQLLTYVPAAANPLIGDWSVTGYNNGKQAVTSPLPGTQLTVTFAEDGTVSGSSGCNTFRGEYTLEGDALTVGPLASTKMACEQPAMGQETQFLTALQTPATVETSGTTVTLRDADGSTQVVLAPK